MKDNNEVELVNIANPVMLGVKIALGMFVVFPLFIFCLCIVLLIFGVSLW